MQASPERLALRILIGFAAIQALCQSGVVFVALAERVARRAPRRSGAGAEIDASPALVSAR